MNELSLAAANEATAEQARTGSMEKLDPQWMSKLNQEVLLQCQHCALLHA